jgi:hypothetical protein
MTGQQLRFSRVDQDSINVLLQDYLNSAIEEEDNGQPFVAPGTQAGRDRIWIAWTEHVFGRGCLWRGARLPAKYTLGALDAKKRTKENR